MNKYRYADYYNLTETFDNLYQQSKGNETFNRLMPIITSEQNIRLAYRTIKANKGSVTAGTDGMKIENIKEMNIEDFIHFIQKKFEDYKPDAVRRVYIPKPNGDKRPLGIPTITDRIIQQAIKQVLEPICEAKFHNHSYGFRPNRSTGHAIARMNSLININGLYYVVDVDIKGFFDNVNHNKLTKQIYTLGIRDRKLLAIIKAMLKAPIEGEGIPKKGTPQGGILSPLLSNIVLNELDWWISNQWETFPTKYDYSAVQPKLKAMKKSGLKEMYIVRYADDFKIFCRSYHEAKRSFEAVKQWLKERLKLDISPEKSKIVNLKKNYSEYLGIEVKAIQRGNSRNGYIAKSNVRQKAKQKMIKELKHQVIEIQKHTTGQNVIQLNSMILGMQQYYKCATMVSKDFREIAFIVNRSMFARFKRIAYHGKVDKLPPIFDKFYKGRDFRTWVVHRIPIYPIWGVKNQPPMCFSQDICDYTIKGREKSSKALKNVTYVEIIQYAENYDKNETVQFNDNRISRASMCQMKCEITGERLNLENISCCRLLPKELGGTDEYHNLRIVHRDIQKVIQTEKVTKKMQKLIENPMVLRKVNSYRKMRKLEPIIQIS